MKSIVHSFEYGLDYLREQVADVPEADMVAQPGGMVNHPAWSIGHLTWIMQEIGGVVGVTPWLDESWTERFGPGGVPVAQREVYESKEKALAMLREAQTRLTDAVASLDDTRLDQPFPDPSYHEVFPTIRHALTQVLVGHTAYHVGQVSMWRKAMGLPPIGRAFE